MRRAGLVALVLVAAASPAVPAGAQKGGDEHGVFLPRNADRARALLAEMTFPRPALYPSRVPPGFARARILVFGEPAFGEELGRIDYAVQWVVRPRTGPLGAALLTIARAECAFYRRSLREDRDEFTIRRTTVRHRPARWLGNPAGTYVSWCEDGDGYAAGVIPEHRDWRRDRLVLRALIRALEPVE